MIQEPTAGTLGVSRETFDKLGLYVELLKQWQGSLNLVSRTTLPVVWDRHIRDSLQLIPYIHHHVLADMGTGAGFPGMVLALARDAVPIHLIDSDGRKVAFLREVSRRTGAPVQVHLGRVETVLSRLEPVPSLLVARGLAPLLSLLRLGSPLLANGTSAVFLKGKAWQTELTEARKAWRFDVDVQPSQTDPEARILHISEVKPAAQS